ncbi:hypothetical protein I7I51_00533 [Histoplasma capsulatum]|uniref:Uncharacterized protein n=1 Tax=Ajellomyces capsulatus TaxID=5037 RepID=A0A8A1MCA8_AJECA|nr:hypothetical protein I7I51_00533 [Histoplasma capsulatum]
MPQDRIGYHVVGGASRPRGEAGERTKHRVGACLERALLILPGVSNKFKPRRPKC